MAKKMVGKNSPPPAGAQYGPITITVEAKGSRDSGRDLVLNKMAQAITKNGFDIEWANTTALAETERRQYKIRMKPDKGTRKGPGKPPPTKA